MKFVPDFALREICSAGPSRSVSLASPGGALPVGAGREGRPLRAGVQADIKPEWYFMFMFQSLKLVPGGEIAGIEYEAIPILLFGLGAALIVLVPFLDRNVSRTGRSRTFTVIGVVTLIYMVGMTTWGYHSLVPIWIVVATALILLLLGYATRRERRRAE